MKPKHCKYAYLPKFNSFVIGGEKKLCIVCCRTPSNLIYFFLDFNTLEIIKLFRKQIRIKTVRSISSSVANEGDPKLL